MMVAAGCSLLGGSCSVEAGASKCKAGPEKPQKGGGDRGKEMGGGGCGCCGVCFLFLQDKWRGGNRGKIKEKRGEKWNHMGTSTFPKGGRTFLSRFLIRSRKTPP